MTPFPPDAKRVVLAAVVPCPACRGEKYVTRLVSFGPFASEGNQRRRCESCRDEDGKPTGLSTVVTDIEVEREQMYAGPREAEWDTPEDVWVEVRQ